MFLQKIANAFRRQEQQPVAPSITAEQVALVKDSWNSIIPVQDTASMMLYKRLFEIDPDSTKLFDGPIADQGRKMMGMIGSTVLALDDIEALLPMVKSLGRRHALQYSVQAKDYDAVGEALIWTLEKALGPELSAETREAWICVYQVLADTMIKG